MILKIRRKKSQTVKKLGEKQSFWPKMSKSPPMCRADFPMRSAFLQLILEAFPVSKFSPSEPFGKVYLYNFQHKWNFWIWPPFAPPKLSSPNTTSCVSKKGQKGHFLSIFNLFGGSKPVKISWPLVGMHIFPWKIQKFWVCIKRSPLSKARARWRGA